MIELRAGTYWLRLPDPVQRFELPTQTPMSIDGKTEDVVTGSRTVRVTREGEVWQHLACAVVVFPKLTAPSQISLHPFASELATFATGPSGVRSFSDAMDHFELDHDVRVESPLLVECDWGSVVTFDLSKHGWVPGNTFVYLIPRDPKRGAIFLDGTWFLEFEWDAVSIG